MHERATSLNNGCSCSQAAKSSTRYAEGSTTIPYSGREYHVKRSTAQINGVGETPLNGKGMT